MRSVVLVVVGGVAVLVGGVWALQGSGVLGGSAMTDSTPWLVIGLAVALAGAMAVALGARGRA